MSLVPTRAHSAVAASGGQMVSRSATMAMVDPAWFDADVIADAGNVSPEQMQSGFTALRPTLELGKYAALPDLVGDRAAQLAFRALDIWASDNVPFPAAAYRTYIGELYQGNRLIAGSHRALGARRSPAGRSPKPEARSPCPIGGGVAAVHPRPSVPASRP